jgi:hypothetical protein
VAAQQNAHQAQHIFLHLLPASSSTNFARACDLWHVLHHKANCLMTCFASAGCRKKEDAEGTSGIVVPLLPFGKIQYDEGKLPDESNSGCFIGQVRVARWYGTGCTRYHIQQGAQVWF